MNLFTVLMIVMGPGGGAALCMWLIAPTPPPARTRPISEHAFQRRVDLLAERSDLRATSLRLRRELATEFRALDRRSDGRPHP